MDIIWSYVINSGDVRLDPHTIYEEYKREMGVSKIYYRNIPRCFNYGLLYKDLVVQDFMLSGMK